MTATAGATAGADGGSFESYSVVAIGDGVPGIAADRGLLNLGLVVGGTVLNATHSDKDTAIDIDFLPFLAVGIDGILCTARTDGIHQTSVEVDIAVGVDAVVVAGAGIDVAVADSQVLSRVDAVVVGVDVNLAASDIEVILALDAFAVIATGGHFHFATTDDHSAAIGVAVAHLCLHAGLDAFGRRIVVAADIVGVAGIVGVLCGTIIIV